ncbi:MAG: putative mRNA 3-end processing factor [Methanothermococcus sp.]|uniref:MBL fold metallo-hydrolase n=1 Tax=Methanothermococcus TaxID=155862 RepID=UPI0003723C3D|nr:MULTISPECIES: MBL fold metallo-hydrolase [Methanothermococcus]MDK2790081.1 putative mRNA 3-end processing factor [Methanothermococcus sp.]MDK2987989.1 putative mRNA 3-end processing factor [Methanothermococcus sp.]
MEIFFRGGAMEVGRSCIEVKTDQSSVLFDCGIKLSPEGPEYPILKDANPDCIFISHAHLDHTGSLPVLVHSGVNPAIFSTHMTKALTKELLKDSLKIALAENLEELYDRGDVHKTIKLHRKAKYNKTKHFKDFDFEFFNAGHIPGSASILLDYGNKKLVYTGDTKVLDTELVKGADLSYCKESIDVLIVESTYGGEVHPDRGKIEKEFLEKVKETVERKGVAIIPVFAVDRSQEILLVLNNLGLDIPIYFDGLAKKITEIMLRYPEYLKNPEDLKKVFLNVYEVDNKDRQHVIKDLKENGGIVVTTAGMLEGGPVVTYMWNFWNDTKSSLILTGYQVEDTVGRRLIETGELSLGELSVKPKFEVSLYEFSAHGDMNELRKIVKKADPGALIVQHGEEESISLFNDWAVENGYITFTPKLGDKIDLDKVL